MLEYFTLHLSPKTMTRHVVNELILFRPALIEVKYTNLKKSGSNIRVVFSTDFSDIGIGEYMNQSLSDT